MNLKLKRNIKVRETGIVIQPKLFWLAASPDGFVIDENTDKKYGLIEIKCPASKKNISVHELVQDPNFYVYLDNGKPTLKKTHSNGYYSQIQLAMGLSGIKFCDFIVYTYKRYNNCQNSI